MAETAEQVLDVLADPDAGPRRGAAARARVLAEHTSAHRAQQLEAVLVEVGAGPNP